MPFSPRRSPPKGCKEDMTTEERDQRTIFIMQIAARTKPRDLEEFCGSVGHVRDVRIITDSKTRRSKGIAYVEFWELEAVPLAIGLNGQRLLGAPLIIQASQADKNRQANQGSVGGVAGFGFDGPAKGPLKLYVGSLHFNITEDMLRGIFEPFGRIEELELMKEPDTGKSRGYGFVTFAQHDDAKRAMEQLNGFELAGRPIKVPSFPLQGFLQSKRLSSPPGGERDRAHPPGGRRPTARLRLRPDAGGGGAGPGGRGLGDGGAAESHGEAGGGHRAPAPQPGRPGPQPQPAERRRPAHRHPVLHALQHVRPRQRDRTGYPPLPGASEGLRELRWTWAGWENDIKDDVIEECSKHGGVLHIFVDKAAKSGNVYVKCPSVASAVASVNSLHGRWFAGESSLVPILVPSCSLQLGNDDRENHHGQLCPRQQLPPALPGLHSQQPTPQAHLQVIAYPTNPHLGSTFLLHPALFVFERDGDFQLQICYILNHLLQEMKVHDCTLVTQPQCDTSYSRSKFLMSF